MTTRRRFSGFPAVALIAAIACGGFALSRAFSADNDAALRSDSADRPIRLETFRTHSRFSIRVDSQVSTVWKDTQGGFELLLKGQTLTDLGAPIGYESEWVRQFSDVRDSRISEIRIEETKAGVRIAGKWKFPAGDNAPAKPAMERFEFRQESPASFVVDFWEQKGPTVAEMKKRIHQQRQKENVKRLEAEAKRRDELRKAAANRIETAGDLSLFCRLPRTEDTDVFLHFSPLHRKFPFEKWFSLSSPDAHYQYLIPKGDDSESTHVRVALELYQQSKPALVMRAIDFLEQEHPKSEHIHEMRFLRANAMIRLGLDAEAEKVFRTLMIDAKGSPVALLGGMHVAGRALERGENLAALESFLWLSKNYTPHAMNWIFHFGVAEALFALKQTERATAEYDAVIRYAPDADAQAEAALRMGDSYMERHLYEQAIASYFKGANFYKEQAERFAPVHLNRAEAMYWLGQYPRAEAEFRDFLVKYPADPAGWRAAYRIAEILGRKPGPENAASSREWYYKTVNTYPFSSGALISRMRLAQCGDHGGLDATGVTRLFDTEAAKFEGQGEISMERFPDYYHLSRIRAMISIDREDEAVRLGVEAMRKVLTPSTRKILAAMLNRSLRRHALDLLAAGRKYEAISFFNTYSGSTASDGEAMVPDFLLELADAAVELGLGTMAQKLMDSYRTSLARFEKEMAGRQVAAEEKDDLDRKIRSSREKVTDAKAIWIRAGAKGEAEIRAKLAEVSEESPLSYEKEVLLALIAEKSGDLKAAVAHALKANVLASGKSRPVMAQVGHWAAGLLVTSGNTRMAISLLSDAQKKLDQSRKPAKEGEAEPAPEASAGTSLLPAVPDPAQVTLALAELLEKDHRWIDAADLYARIIEGGGADNRILYSYASALRKKGSRKDRAIARETLEKVAGSEKEDFWKQMAKETLENEKEAKWRPTFKE